MAEHLTFNWWGLNVWGGKVLANLFKIQPLTQSATGGRQIFQNPPITVANFGLLFIPAGSACSDEINLTTLYPMNSDVFFLGRIRLRNFKNFEIFSNWLNFMQLMKLFQFFLNWETTVKILFNVYKSSILVKNAKSSVFILLVRLISYEYFCDFHHMKILCS